MLLLDSRVVLEQTVGHAIVVAVTAKRCRVLAYTLKKLAVCCYHLTDSCHCTVLHPVTIYIAITDKSSAVQEAACSALATVEEMAGEQLVPYLQPILGALVAASHKYQVRSSVVLYDAIGTLADVMGQHLVQPQASALFPLSTVLRNTVCKSNAMQLSLRCGSVWQSQCSANRLLRVLALDTTLITTTATTAAVTADACTAV
eukprot:3579-Heterococcus_DN1.PRE.3